MEEIRLEEKLFGGKIIITIFDAPRDDTEEILIEAYTEALRLQKIFNFYDKDSMLSRLNKERKLEVRKEFLEVLNPAIKMSKETNGLYDITHGENFKKRKRKENLNKLKCSYEDIKINGPIIELISKDTVLDFGSLAKGYITDKIAEFLKSKGLVNGLIDSRGDILSFGGKEHIIQIQNPRSTKDAIDSIKIKNAGVATSGDYMQYNKDFNKSHILNNKEYASTTIVAPTLMQADLYATVFLVVKEKKIQEMLKKKKDLMALCVTKDLRIKRFNGFEKIEVKDSLRDTKEEGDIHRYFSKDSLHSKPNSRNIGPVGSENFEEDSEVEEWFIDDGPLREDAREIFVRPGKFHEQKTRTRAS